MQLRRWGFLGLVLALALALAGCANTAAKRTADGALDLDLTTKAGEGHAVLRVISLRPVSLLNPKWQQVNLISNGLRAEMTDVTSASNAFFQGRYFATESLYFAKLRAGKYEVTGFGSIGPGPGLIPALIASDNAKATTLPSFTIEAGTLANLGTLVFAPELGKDQPAQMILLRGPMGKNNALDTLLAESARADMGLAAGGGWDGDMSTQDEQKLLAQARRLVSQLYLRVGAQGLAGGSHLGQTLHRSGTDQWTRDSADTLATVFAVARTADGQTVAGSEYGTYLVKSAQGVWQTNQLPGDRGRVVYVEPRGAKGVMLVSVGPGGSRFWVRDSFEPQAAPQEVAKLETLPDLVLSTADELLIPGNIPGISRETEIRRIDKSSFAVTKQKHDFWVREWQRFPDGEIVMTRQNGLSLYRSKSADGGKSWVHDKTASGASNYWMDPRNAYSLEYKAGFSTVTNHLQKTSDGGNRWENLGTPLVTQDFAGSIVYADSTEIIVQSLGMLFSTRDEGTTWTRIFPPKP